MSPWSVFWIFLLALCIGFYGGFEVTDRYYRAHVPIVPAKEVLVRSVPDCTYIKPKDYAKFCYQQHMAEITKPKEVMK